MVVFTGGIAQWIVIRSVLFLYGIVCQFYSATGSRSNYAGIDCACACIKPSLMVFIFFLVQGLVGAVFEGVGVSLGSFIGGILYHEYGGPWTFRFFGVCALVCCLVHAGVQFVIARLCSSDSDGGGC